MVTVMTDLNFPVDDILVSDATAAALRDLMAKSKNILVTLSDEYKMTMGSLKIGTQVKKMGIVFALISAPSAFGIEI